MLPVIILSSCNLPTESSFFSLVSVAFSKILINPNPVKATKITTEVIVLSLILAKKFWLNLLKIGSA